MTTFTPTAEQTEIVNAAVESDANMSVIARAGAAKTSTLVLIAEALPQKNLLCLAFNKKIADEMHDRLPPNCESKTLHGLGYKAWWGFVRKKMRVDKSKTYRLLKEQIADIENQQEKSEAFEFMSETMDFISAAKQQGYLPDAFKGHWRPLINDHDFFAGLPMEPSDLQIDLIKTVLVLSFREALEGNIDFDDMIYCPALCSVSWPSPDVTLVDEAQDLAPINHHILKKIVRNNRLIAVGDPKQAIYGFRGASVQSMNELHEMFKTELYYLTISFRCSKAVTKNAHWLAPDMKSPEWAIPGEVSRPLMWGPDDIKDGDAIICRNNAPLFSVALHLLEAGRLPEIVGRDLSKPLIKILSKLGKDKMPRAAALEALKDWEANQLRRAREGARGGIHDRAACLRIMIDKTKTLGDAKAYLTHLMNRDGRIYLATGHKSKGLEYDNVFFLDAFLCRIEKGQDANIKYVIETRAKDRLTYVTSEGYISENGDGISAENA